MKDQGQARQARPQWLDDEPEIIALLHGFLDRLEQKPLAQRTRPLAIKLSAKTMPRLFRSDEAADRSWALLQSLDGCLFEISLDRRRQPYDPEYTGASLRWLEQAESLCRAWLSRPLTPSYAQQWANALERYGSAFADAGESLRPRPLRVAGKSADEVVQAFARLDGFNPRRATLRQLSAWAFWGNSKLLDSRQDLLRKLHPTLQIAPRPVLVQVRLPASPQGVLFIENQDNYIQALSRQSPAFEGLALVYAAGFKGAAERIRSPQGVSLHYQGDTDPALRRAYEIWWHGGEDAPGPLWFWGDLDYAGMAILKQLRRRFGELRAWQPGYRPMLQLLQAGAGHAPEAADKTEQADPGETGCEFADTELLPEIRRTGRFLDQEYPLADFGQA